MQKMLSLVLRAWESEMFKGTLIKSSYHDKNLGAGDHKFLSLVPRNYKYHYKYSNLQRGRSHVYYKKCALLVSE